MRVTVTKKEMRAISEAVNMAFPGKGDEIINNLKRDVLCSVTEVDDEIIIDADPEYSQEICDKCLKMFMPVIQNIMSAVNMFKIAMDTANDTEIKWIRTRTKEKKEKE